MRWTFQPANSLHFPAHRREKIFLLDEEDPFRRRIRALLSHYLSMDMPHSNIVPSPSSPRQNANYFPQSYKCHLEVSHSGNRCHICIERIAYPHCPESWRDGKRIPCGFHRNHLSTNM
ncbi:hypothetical protein CEXT_254721 [Caerostris extrusa]|uniref:Uncharacterized protein n=1 Tax=Caerostris extrusa TaxID=172846 RepID=A0AAV4Q0Z7_CAEEX|nr:hypothetical protein CEXT_254721 [Caerostris extrusa]